MRIEILQETLVKGLSLVSRTVASRPQIAVLANILIEAEKEGVTISATDLELGIKIKLQANVIEEGVVTVPARNINEFVASINPGKIEISMEKENLIVKSGTYSAKFQTISADEFPRLPSIKKGQEAILVKREVFAEGASSVTFAAARDSLRPVLTGVLMEIGKTSLNLVATDGFRLATCKVVKEKEIEEKTLLVPMRAISEVARLEEGENLEIMSNSLTNQVVFRVGEAMVVTQVIEGNFPDYRKIIPQETELEIKIQKEELLQAVKATNIFARDNSNMMRWEIKDNKLIIKAETPERGESVVEIPIEKEGEEKGEVVFNTKFLLDFLTTVKGEVIKFGMKETLSPGTFRVEGNSDLLYVVMPINA